MANTLAAPQNGKRRQDEGRNQVQDAALCFDRASRTGSAEERKNASGGVQRRTSSPHLPARRPRSSTASSLLCGHHKKNGGSFQSYPCDTGISLPYIPNRARKSESTCHMPHQTKCVECMNRRASKPWCWVPKAASDTARPIELLVWYGMIWAPSLYSDP